MSRRFGSPTPYDQAEGDRRKRKRYLSRSDEEIIEEMDPGHVSYRRGWPTLAPLPLDTEIRGARAMIPGSAEILQDVQHILATQGLLTGGTSFYFAFRVPRDATEENDDAEYLTLFITVDMLKHSHQIANTILRIRSRFRENTSTDDIQIECIDFRARHDPTSFTIRYDEQDLRQKWQAISPSVLSLLNHHEWLSVEFLRRGLIDSRQECSPTIVITTPSARDPKWFDNIVPSIKAEIADTAPELDVEILCGVTMMGARRRYKATDKINGTSYVKDIRMGSSLGISPDNRACSTLGGSVTLTGGVRCGITNWHCVRDGRLDNVVSKTTSKALGVENKTLMNAPQRMISPATVDHEGHLGVLQDQIEELRNQVSAGVTHARAELKEKEDELKNRERFARGVGYVYAGSGRRTIEANKYASDPYTGKSKDKGKVSQPTFVFPLDWALIRIDDVQNRDVINNLPDVTLPMGIASKLVPSKLCNRWSTFNVNKEEVHVAKYGRTSGWTLGTINSCMLYINPENDVEISAVYGFDMKNQGSCFGVVSEDKNKDFIELGDPGSILVHDGSGTQLGLLFGVTSSGEGMFLPSDIVFQDIKRITGRDVVEPSFVGPQVVGLAPYQLAE